MKPFVISDMIWTIVIVFSVRRGALVLAEQIKLDQQIGCRLTAERGNDRVWRLPILAVTPKARRHALRESVAQQRLTGCAEAEPPPQNAAPIKDMTT